ncbi:MAG: hypothetical protein E7049_09600 [Lentisphaerae bacterium]|nr:hypothetical protein [Lentisphaerota bacterium]
MKTRKIISIAVLIAPLAVFAAGMSEISVDLKLDSGDYVTGERVRGVVKIINKSPVELSVGHPDSTDKLYVEVYASFDMSLLDLTSRKPFVGKFRLPVNGVQKLEVLLGDHYNLRQSRRFLARPILVHGGMRYEGQYRAFDVVPGTEITKALQVFSNRNGLQREFKLVWWPRNQTQHLFMVITDQGDESHPWETRDLGAMMKIEDPTISIMPSGEVIVLHRYGPDNFIRSEFWSLPDTIEFHTRELVNDPETAGHSRVQELYRESGGVKPVERPWWKFW